MKTKIKQFFINIGTSGKYAETNELGMSDYLIRYVLLNFIIIVGAIILVIFTILNIRKNVYIGAIATGGMALVGILCFFISRTRIPQIVPAFTMMVFYGLMCVIIVQIGTAHGANFLFIYIYPLLTIMILGMRNGVILSLVLLCIVSLKMFIPGLSEFNYHSDISTYMLINYLMVLSVMIVLEITRKIKDRLIGIQKQRIQALKERAEASDHAKSEFLATVSHEIRTPMNAILGITQIQLQKEGLPGEYTSALEKIYVSGKNLLGIINDILDMSKIEAGNLELNLITYDVPSLINDAVQLNIVRLGSKAVVFNLDIDENLPSRLYGDELRLKQILNNLLSNAIKYTDNGFIKLKVSHSVRDGNVRLRFDVEDTGQGIKPEDQEKLFSEYLRFNAKANRTTEGTGLGLSITKRLAQMMDGEISVKSEYGKGSIFTVTVRQGAVECAVIGADLARRLSNFTFTCDRQSAGLQIIRNSMPYGKVLVVDDVETNLYVTEGLLVPYKLKVETANSGFAAIEKVKAGNTYDIIFMDHMMPQMDGMEATAKLRELGYTDIIVALTANALVGNNEMFMQNGFDGFIPKPIDVRQLNNVLNKFIRDRHPEEAKKYKPETVTQTTEINPKVLQIFRNDAKEAIVTLRETKADGNIKLFTTTAHAMKSALANVGEHDSSAMAAKLENAGLNGDTEYISANTESFIHTLEALIAKISPTDVTDNSVSVSEDTEEDTAYLAEQLHIIKAACEEYDSAAAYSALDRLQEKTWKAGTAELLEEIRDAIYLDSDFDRAAEIIQRL